MRRDHNIVTFKGTAKALCFKCGSLTIAICGVHNVLCEKCLNIKKNTKPKKLTGGK